MPPDIEKYRRYVDHFDLSEAEKIDFIHTVWFIGQSFVDRAFGDDPVQVALRDSSAKCASGDGPVIDFRQATSGVFADTAIPTKEREET